MASPAPRGLPKVQQLMANSPLPAAADPDANALDSLQPIANALKVGVTEVWKMFIRRYLAKGASELLVAAAIAAVAVMKLGNSNWIFLPLALALLIAYDGIQLVINPSYFAVGDIIGRLHDENKKSDSSYY